MLETTIVIIVAGAVTLISLIIRYCFMSKCNSGSCFWGCIKFHRNTEQETNNVPQESTQK